MFKRNPILGNGSTDIPARAASWSYKEISGFHDVRGVQPGLHNDMLFIMASHGVPGLRPCCWFTSAPATISLRRLALDLPQQTRVAAAIGLSEPGFGAFMVFGLTELMFRGMCTMGFYVVMMGWALALSDPRALLNGALPAASKKDRRLYEQCAAQDGRNSPCCAMLVAHPTTLKWWHP